MPDGFPEYGPEDLAKVSALRRAKSEPSFYGIPILSEASVLFVTAASREDKPNWCGTCVMYNTQDFTCSIHSPEIVIKSFVVEPQKFWPVCGYHKYGPTNDGEPMRQPPYEDPDHTGLSWVNTPDDGREHGGTTCGGLNDGDDCDFYNTPGDDKREYASGFCQVLRKDVGGGDCCAAWQDDDLVDWREAQAHFQADAPLSKKTREMVNQAAAEGLMSDRKNSEEEESEEIE